MNQPTKQNTSMRRIQAADRALTVFRYLARVGRELVEQDNRGTAHPLFCVFDTFRVHGVGDEYTDLFEWILDDDGEVVDDETEDALEDKYEAGEPTPGYSRVGYINREQFITAFFTNDAAQSYVAANRHHLERPTVYPTSLHRSYEMIAVRKALIGVHHMFKNLRLKLILTWTAAASISAALAVGRIYRGADISWFVIALPIVLTVGIPAIIGGLFWWWTSKPGNPW